MKKNNYTKTQNLLKFIFLFIVFLGIGYAFLEANLNINGDVTVSAPELNVYVQSTAVTEGSTPGTPTIIGNDKKEVDFTTALTSDGNSFFEETTTLVNKGSKDAYLLSINVKVYSGNTVINLLSPYEYTLSKSDGSPVVIGEKLKSTESTAYKIKYNYTSGTDMSTITDYPTYTFKIVYNYGVEPKCVTHRNVTKLSTDKCANNENVTVSSDTICKRAISLHQETCLGTTYEPSRQYYCTGDGYMADGSKGTTTMTYGNCGSSGTLTSGDAFTCDVNGDGNFDEVNERFYYVSDYYDTTNQIFDNTTAVLLYYTNTSNGIACNVSSTKYNNNGTWGENWHGPDENLIIKDLPTTSQWTAVSLKNDSRSILGEYKSTHNSLITSGGTLPTDFSYSGYAARLLTAQELMRGCNLTELGSSSAGELSDYNFLLENTRYSFENLVANGFWLETPKSSDDKSIWYVDSHSRYADSTNASIQNSGGPRPVIDVPKNKMSY